ncbi:S-adenosyl-L-methionine-dependent methyltransferase [Lipomyces tetrasporus]|uniref:S-adenosyl-L-methionine-dependent methyltransferase n=1 Tax=Lipomyces tetrasporus TaxID=54092 RepID=A0AAD7VVQ4_9ASCO|nr:S-adenosyl-L-methionine-dependent methyltransferase [Lipomyces tetrasporus]KAJ8103748.1 S-adenosyl-L-methionine-dependent methyltransferase [Lipomyces tetrasporus]
MNGHKDEGNEACVSSLSESDSDSNSSSSSDYESGIPRSSLSPLTKARFLAARSILEYPHISDTLSATDSLLLDFACGTGALSQRLASHVDRILGIDIDACAVQHFNTRARNQGIDENEMCAIQCDVLNENSLVHGETWFGMVDGIASAMGFHHLQDIALVTKVLVDRFLKVGGWIAVVDLMYTPYTSAIFANAKAATNHRENDGHVHGHSHHHAHHVGGIKAEDIARAFKSAGLDSVDVFEHVFEISITVPRRLLPIRYTGHESGSSSTGPAIFATPDGAEVEVVLPYLLAVGKKL